MLAGLLVARGIGAAISAKLSRTRALGVIPLATATMAIMMWLGFTHFVR